jgi:hypothetical protein
VTRLAATVDAESPGICEIVSIVTDPFRPFKNRPLLLCISRFVLMVTGVAIFTSCHSDEAVTRVDIPTAPNQMKSLFNVSLPQSAKNMYLASHAGGLQKFEEYVRFEVQPEETVQAIQAIMDWDIKGQTGIVMYETMPLDSSNYPTPSRAIGRLAWWNLNSIQHGYSYVKKTHTRIFWIDEDRNIVYLYWTN